MAIVLVLFFAVRAGKSIFNLISPPPPAPPTVAYGKLPAIDLSSGIQSDTNISYKVETISGDIPNLASRAKVFKIKRGEDTFGILGKAEEKAQALAFSPTPEEMTASQLTFVDPKIVDRTLTIDTSTGNFKLDSNFYSDPEVIDTRPKSIESAKSIAVEFLSNFETNQKLYPPEKMTTSLFRIENGGLVDAISLSFANLVKVNFYKADLDKIPVLYLNADDPLVWALVSQSSVLKAEKSVNEIQKNNFATYPLKGASTAFKQLEQGGGVFNKLPQSDIFIIRNVKLAYIETRKFQPYCQPVYIFEGDDGVMAFVGAVSGEWIDVSRN